MGYLIMGLSVVASYYLGLFMFERKYGKIKWGNETDSHYTPSLRSADVDPSA